MGQQLAFFNCRSKSPHRFSWIADQMRNFKLMTFSLVQFLCRVCSVSLWAHVGSSLVQRLMLSCTSNESFNIYFFTFHGNMFSKQPLSTICCMKSLYCNLKKQSAVLSYVERLKTQQGRWCLLVPSESWSIFIPNVCRWTFDSEWHTLCWLGCCQNRSVIWTSLSVWKHLKILSVHMWACGNCFMRVWSWFCSGKKI